MKVAIIGGGLGGLSVGALLAKRGFIVTLLEQHNIVGGCATTFKRGDFICEAGLHELDGLHQSDIKTKIFQELGIFERIEFVKIPQFFNAKFNKSNFIMPHNIDDAKKSLKDEFPNEANGIDKYFKKIESISKALDEMGNLKNFMNILKFPKNLLTILMNSNRNIGSFLDSIIKDEKLKVILNANVFYYHDNPYKLSLIYHAVAQYGYFFGGSWYIKGGSQKLSNALADIIRENGGEVIVNAKVNKLSTTDKNISSISYEKKGKVFEVKSDICIANCSPFQIYSMLDKSFYDDKIDKLEIAPSLFTVYLGFNKNLNEIYPNNSYSTFMLEDKENLKDLNAKETPLKDRVFSFVDYSKVDSNLTSKDKSFGVLCGVDYIKDWENLTKDEYKAKKEEIKNNFLDRLEKHYPNIKNYIEYSELATSKTIKRYTLSDKGTAYGFAQTPKQVMDGFKIKAKKVDNLYFVGSWSEPASGFSGVIISGWFLYNKLKDKI